MYLFITYARKEMKGVQIRGIRVAKYLPKKEVMFFNGGNDDWLKKEGYKYKNYDFNKFYLPSKIKIPKNTKCIVFCDLPTNRAFQVSLLMLSRQQRIPCVVLDNIYRREQTEDTVYRNIRLFSDRLILSGLDFMKKNKPKNVSIVPPLIDNSLIAEKEKDEIRKEMIKKLKIKTGPEKVVFCVAYNPFIYEQTLKIYDYLQKEKKNVLFVVVSQTKTTKRKANLIEIPPLKGDEMSFFTKASDLVICKAGYLQIIEALAIGVPVIAFGQASLETKKGKIIVGKGTSGFKKRWLDKKILEVVTIADSFSESVGKRIKKLLFSPKYHQNITKKIKALHSSKLNGAKLTAELIKKTKFHPKSFPKILIISLDKEQETEEVKRVLRKYPFALPIYFSIPFFTNVFNRRLSEYDPTLENESLHYNPALVYSFDFDSLHSFAKIFPWYNSLFESIEYLVKNSDKCIVIGKETYNYLEKAGLEKYKKKIKIIDKNFKYNIRGK